MKQLHILHFNDCYDIEPRQAEPCGGAARLAAKIKSLGDDVLVLFSGDAYHPSLLSTITQGKQMVEVLNACNVRAACVGNHDLDGGVETFVQFAQDCRFPWLMANVIDVKTGKPLAGAQRSVLLDWQGVRLGLMGLVEGEWLTTLSHVDPEDVRYIDFVEEGERLAAELRAQGAEVVIALTHMRLPNDLRLAQSAPGIDLVLGGHDHEYYLLNAELHDIAMAKSGTDFRDCTEIIVAITRDSSACTEAAAAAAAEVAGGMAAGAGAAAAEGAGEAALSPRLLAAARLGSLKLAPERLAQLGRVPTAVADTMAELAERAQQRCSKWARLAGIPALAGCQLASWLGKSSSSSSDLKDAEQPECPDCHAASGGGEGATPQGQDAASVYETYADASLATSLLSCRTAGGAAQAAGAAAAPPVHLAVQCVRHTITSDVPEDPEVAEIVERYKAVMGERMDVVVGYSATDLDGRFATVRTSESNLGNFICDVWREACGADAALCNGGTFRSDRIHPAGALTHRDLVSILPMLDDTVVIRVTGAQLLGALENGVSQWPKHEGRFPQVSGIRFVFDPSLPVGQRVLPGSITVGEAALQPDACYSLATKAYLAEGRDGYEALVGTTLLKDADCTPLLPTVVANHFLLLRTVNQYAESTGRVKGWQRAAERLLGRSSQYASKSQQRLEEEGVSHTARKHPLTGRWEIAPVLDGRIQRVGGSVHGGSQAGSVHGSADGAAA